MREAIEESRKMQNDMRQKQKDEDDALALEMQRRWKLRNEQLNADEKRSVRNDMMLRKRIKLLAGSSRGRNERDAKKEKVLFDKQKLLQQVSEEEGRFFDEVRKALRMEPGANNHSVKKCQLERKVARSLVDVK